MKPSILATIDGGMVVVGAVRYALGLAMQGELTTFHDEGRGLSGLELDTPQDILSKLATHWYRIADAMLEARK